MQKLDNLLEFLIENKEDDRISIFKRMKYGYRYYYLYFNVDEDPNPVTNSNQSYGFKYRDSLEIIFDNRNECIEVNGGDEEHALIIENSDILKKWSTILEEIVSDNLEDRVVGVFEKSLNDCFNKNLYRELQMKKIFKEDESL